MDAFFASVEQHDHPEWRGRPVIVGAGPRERGVVSTCSYEARQFGVHSAMPSRTAYQRCPQAVFVTPRMSRYEEVSQQVFAVFEHYTPYVEAVSIDEAFLDITGSIHLYGTAEDLATALQREILKTCGITCSVGIATNRLLAKIGSEQHKPNGLTVMPTHAAEIAAFLAPKPLSILWGIGERTRLILKPYGLITCGDLQRLPPHQLATLLGEDTAQHLIDHAFGRSSSEVHWQKTDEKSVSREYTFPEDCTDRNQVRAQLLALVKEVGRRFRAEKRWALTARIKVRDEAFNTFTRQMSFPRPARDDISFRQAALALFEKALPSRSFTPLRLIGFGVTNLTKDATGDLLLFPDEAVERQRRHERLSEAIDALHQQGHSVGI